MFLLQTYRVLQEALEEQRELTNKIQNEYEALQKEVLAKDLVHKKKVQDMTKEIDVLKNQLKKYVAAVQTLRKDKQLTDEMTSGEIMFYHQVTKMWQISLKFSTETILKQTFSFRNQNYLILLLKSICN